MLSKNLRGSDLIDTLIHEMARAKTVGMARPPSWLRVRNSAGFYFGIDPIQVERLVPWLRRAWDNLVYDNVTTR